MVNRTFGLLTLICLTMASGCSMYRQTVPGYCVSDGFYESRSDKEPINFLRLRQTPPVAYRLDERDVLGIYIEGVLGNKDEPPPVHFPEQGDTPPAIGYPVPVREDGTVSLPLVRSVEVRGLTLSQAEQKIRQAFLDEKILRADRDRIIVTLMRPRTYHILVVREDGNATQAFNGNISPENIALQGIFGNNRGGESTAVELQAYENDVLHALTETGGMPGNDAISEVFILRGGFANSKERDYFMNSMDGSIPEETMSRPGVVRIPLRLGPDDPTPEISEQDIILNTGDVVFVKSRETEVFYTGGLLPGGQYPIPRDYDIDVLQAISLAGGSIGTSTGSHNSFFGGNNNAASGIFPATRVIVLREMCGEQVPIEIDLRRAMLDPAERVVIQPGDFITLEYRVLEIVGNILVNNFQFNYFLNQ